MTSPSASLSPSTPRTTMPTELFSALSRLGIAHTIHQHAPVMTVQDNLALRGVIAGLHSKNLFLKDKAGGLWLIVAEEMRSIDLKALCRLLNAGKFSFASAKTLMTYLGVLPGSVTPFAVINDPNGRVRVVLDQVLAAATQSNFHPLDNTQTITVSGSGLVAFLRALDHDPLIIDFTSPGAPALS